MKKNVLLFILLLPAFSKAQDKKPCTFLFSLTQNATSLPTVDFTPIHPGFQIGIAKNWKEKGRFTLTQNFRLGYMYQRLVHHIIPIYTELGYKYRFPFGLGIAAYINAGYAHTFTDVAIFKLNENGEYVKTGRAGKAHVMFGYSAIVSYEMNKGGKIAFTPFIQHQFWMMAPFVKKYVPILPNSTFHIGTYFTINK